VRHDLGLRTKAEPRADGGYKLTGNRSSSRPANTTCRTSSTCPARLPQAPAGSKGISLFAVPKWNVKGDGSLGDRNIWCGGLEHKMGIHGNATAQIVLDGAVGTLVGQPNKGLQAMFVMITARLGVGMRSPA
jgi:alkylation response protein AidB-like acyl-CoA dehydrogenase